MRKTRVEDFVLAKEEKKYSCGHARHGEGFRQAAWVSAINCHVERLASRPIVRDVLLQRIQFLGKIVDTPLQQVSDRQHT
jgi:hypothetical protein